MQSAKLLLTHHARVHSGRIAHARILVPIQEAIV